MSVWDWLSVFAQRGPDTRPPKPRKTPVGSRAWYAEQAVEWMARDPAMCRGADSDDHPYYEPLYFPCTRDATTTRVMYRLQDGSHIRVRVCAFHAFSQVGVTYA